MIDRGLSEEYGAWWLELESEIVNASDHSAALRAIDLAFSSLWKDRGIVDD